MVKGTIKTWFKDKGYGFIAVEGMRADAYFRASDAQGIPADELREGLEVSFEVERNGDRLRAKRVQRAGRPSQQRQNQPPVSSEYRFVNPYNFVRFLPKPALSANSSPAQRLLAPCTPPPHDRWVGMSGRIRCKLTVAKGSLLFISDSEGIQDRGNKHRAYRFFELEGQPAIPATTLRGTIRSVFEAATNSCFSIFHEDDLPLEYREARAPDFTPARVVEILQDGSALLEMLDCTKALPKGASLTPKSVKAAAVKSVYPQRVLLTLNNGTTKPFDSSKSSLKHIPASQRDGLRVAALVTTQPISHRSGRFASFEVEDVVLANQASTLGSSVDHMLIYGWLHATGPNIENKHDERLFFRWETNPAPATVGQLKAQGLIATCAKEAVDEYNRHLSEYWDRHSKNAGVKTLPELSNFVSQGRCLKEGDLVYYTSYTGKDAKVRQMIRSVLIPRRRYNTRRQDLLPNHLHKCTDAHALCPACRTFGWVRSDADDVVAQVATAYGSRVQFTNARLTEDKGTADEILLAILGSPKPTTIRFYLAPQKGAPLDGREDVDANYDAQVKLRGRKMYWHHHAVQKEYTRATDGHNSGRDDQNRTIIGARKPGNEFEFDIAFENLAEVELGALLWSLQLEQGMHHRIGFAKPLGFGSVVITVTELELLKSQERYQSKNFEVGWSDAKDLASSFVTVFQSAMVAVYDKTAFGQLDNVADLRALLSGEAISKMPVHYPRSQQEPDPEGKNFEWFVGNKRSGRQNPGPRLTLSLAADERNGLRLVDRDGNPV